MFLRIQCLFLPSSYVVIGYDFEYVILSILKLHMCSFNGCFLIGSLGYPAPGPRPSYPALAPHKILTSLN